MNARQMVKYRKKRFFFKSSLWEENRWGTIVISFDYIYIYCILMENFETRFYLFATKSTKELFINAKVSTRVRRFESLSRDRGGVARR